MDKMHGLPEIIYDRFVQAARSKMMEHYIGDRRKLKRLSELTDNCDQFPVLYIYGASIFTGSSKGVRLCRRQVALGNLIECRRSHNKEAVRFKLANKSLTWYLLGEAYDYWQSKGYKTGVIMDKVD